MSRHAFTADAMTTNAEVPRVYINYIKCVILEALYSRDYLFNLIIALNYHYKVYEHVNIVKC